MKNIIIQYRDMEMQRKREKALRNVYPEIGSPENKGYGHIQRMTEYKISVELRTQRQKGTKEIAKRLERMDKRGNEEERTKNFSSSC